MRLTSVINVFASTLLITPISTNGAYLTRLEDRSIDDVASSEMWKRNDDPLSKQDVSAVDAKLNTLRDGGLTSDKVKNMADFNTFAETQSNVVRYTGQSSTEDGIFEKFKFYFKLYRLSDHPNGLTAHDVDSLKQEWLLRDETNKVLPVQEILLKIKFLAEAKTFSNLQKLNVISRMLVKLPKAAIYDLYNAILRDFPKEQARKVSEDLDSELEDQKQRDARAAHRHFRFIQDFFFRNPLHIQTYYHVLVWKYVSPRKDRRNLLYLLAGSLPPKA